MEQIKIFIGMEIGRYDGYEIGTVLRTFDNGYKLVFCEGFEEEDNSWDSLWIVKPDDRFGWYGVDDMNINTEKGNAGDFSDYYYNPTNKMRFVK